MAKQIVEIVMPQLAESLVNATIDRWLKQPGDTVDMYEPVCELITDKVNAELPSTVKGKLVKILAGAGEVVDVGTAIALVETEQDVSASAASQPEEQPVSGLQAAAVSPGGTQAPAPAAAFDPDSPMRLRFSPAVQKLAADNGVDLLQVKGTGLGGRITRKDVLDAIDAGNKGHHAPVFPVPAAVASAPPARAAEPPRIPVVEVDEGAAPAGREYAIDVTPIRNTIAKNMRQSVNEIPHAWTMVEVDLTNLVHLRNKLKDDFKKNEGINLTFMPFVLKAVVGAIKEYPLMNSVWAVDKIIVKRDINLSLAVEAKIPS